MENSTVDLPERRRRLICERGGESSRVATVGTVFAPSGSKVVSLLLLSPSLRKDINSPWRRQLGHACARYGLNPLGIWIYRAGMEYRIPAIISSNGSNGNKNFYIHC